MATKACVKLRDRYGAESHWFGFFPSIRLSSDETVGALMGIRGAGSPFHVQWNSKRTTTPSPVLAAVDSFGSLGFVRREGSYNSTNHTAESLMGFRSTSDDVLLLDNVAFHHFPCVPAFADSIGIKLLVIPLHTPWLMPIGGLFSIVKRNDRSTGRIAASFCTR